MELFLYLSIACLTLAAVGRGHLTSQGTIIGWLSGGSVLCYEKGGQASAVGRTESANKSAFGNIDSMFHFCLWERSPHPLTAL